MARAKKITPSYTAAGDDEYLFVVTRDLSGGQNNRMHPSVIPENQADTLQNIDLSVAGERKRRSGLTVVEDLGSTAITGLFGYDPQGYTANLLATHGTKLERWTGAGSFAELTITMTTSLPTKMIKAYKTPTGDVVLLSNGTDNVQEIAPDYTVTDLGDTNTSPPKTRAMVTYRNRVWALKNDLLYFSDTAPTDWSAAFDRTSNAYRMPVGEERAILATRDAGLIILGKEQVWGLNPSMTPQATDKPEKLLDYGCAAGDTACQVGDDYLFLAFDGVRAVKRTIQDKLQTGDSKPLSYLLKDEFDNINWAVITKACAVYWDNKYFISLPTLGSTTNNQVWVYYPSQQAWSIVKGWNVACWATFKVGGQERLYAGEATANGLVYRAWSGASDNGVAIELSEISRAFDMGQPIKKKVGGELKVVAKPSGNYNVSVYGSFDNGGYNLLGTMNVGSNLVTFNTTFPVLFYPDARVYKKFHLDPYGSWYAFTSKIYHNAVTTNADDITIYETSLTSHLEEYLAEEEA
jgi:hypothetical protein